ncbi:MAG: NUDIX hydrolase [Chloroflexota bacterium]|nr:NUDIX hydrolase [Chloroflexota bacterium]
MDDERLIERTVERRVVLDGEYLTFRVDTVEDADGRRHRRELVVHPGAVAIVALVDGDVLLVRQFRAPVGRICLELPAGTLDRAADGSIEDPRLAAARELGEETGYTARQWRQLGRFFTAPGFATEEMHLYLATGLTPVEGYAGPAEDERLDLVRIPWRRAVEMAEEGLIDDAKSLVGLFWLARLAARGELRDELTTGG